MNSIRSPLSPKRGLKTQNDCFLNETALLSKEVCYKLSLCENCQQQLCKAFTGISNGAQMVVGGRSLVPEILRHSDPPSLKTPIFFSIFARIASAVTPSEEVRGGGVENVDRCAYKSEFFSRRKSAMATKL